MTLIPYDRDAKIRAAIIESDSVPGQAAMAVVNPDGTDISGGGMGGGDVNLIEVGGSPISLGQAAEADSLPVVLPSTQIDALSAALSSAASPIQTLGSDSTGQDAYATVKTPTADASHIEISLSGSNDAIISLDGGVTDHIYIQAMSIHTLDNVQITSGVAIQAKNAIGGSNYSGLNISIW